MARWVGIGTQQPQAGVEPTTSLSQVRHRTTRPPRTMSKYCILNTLHTWTTVLALMVMCSWEASGNVCPMLRDIMSRFWQPLRTSRTLTFPSDASRSNVDIGPPRASWSHVQAVCDWFVLQESIVRTHWPARKSQTVTVPEVRPQLSRQFWSTKSSREISSLAERPRDTNHITYTVLEGT